MSNQEMPFLDIETAKKVLAAAKKKDGESAMMDKINASRTVGQFVVSEGDTEYDQIAKGAAIIAAGLTKAILAQLSKQSNGALVFLAIAIVVGDTAAKIRTIAIERKTEQRCSYVPCNCYNRW